MLRLNRLAAALLFAVVLLVPLAASGSNDTESADKERAEQDETKYSVFQIRETFPGDPLFLYVESPLAITHVSAVLVSPEGKTVASGDGFTIETQNKAIVPLPVSSFTKPAVFTAKITAVCVPNAESPNTSPSIHEYTISVPIQHKKFVTETIQLDNKNTSIRTDDSEERKQQIAKLNGILAQKGTDVYTLVPFIVPVDGNPRRSSFFADRRIYEYVDKSKATALHHGIDFAIPTGTPVHACADGKVLLAEWRNSTGWSVVIEHMPGLYSIYYHLDSLDTTQGNSVQSGDVIGLSGSTGLATGPHLHWEIRLNMESVNPDFFLVPFIPAR